MKNIAQFTAVSLVMAVAAMWIVGCKGGLQSQNNHAGAAVQASHARTPVVVDGKLDDEVWLHARAYPMQASLDKIAEGRPMQESGMVRLAWDKEYLYVGLELTDSDIVAEGKADNQLHYSFGDVAEVFLKPDDYTWYWELYATPAGKMSTFWFPGRGRLGLPSCFEGHHFDMKVAAQCEGTLNNWQDKDIRWTAEMAIPVSELTARGESFDPQARWHILVARYNYSRYLPLSGPEYSMVPQLSQTNYHLLEEYARLELAE